MDSIPSPHPTDPRDPARNAAADVPGRAATEPAEDEALAALRFTTRLLAATEPRQIAQAVVDVVQALGAGRARVTVGSRSEQAAAQPIEVPLRHRERHLGSLVIEGPEGLADPGPDDRIQRIVTAAAAALARLEDAAPGSDGARDPLTGVGSRTALEQLLVASGSDGSTSIGVVACDLDRFRRVNEGLGRSAGDELLRLVAERLSAAAGERSSVARIGADEFVVTFPDIRSAADLQSRVDALEAAMRPPVRLAGRPFYPSASFGSASAPPASCGDGCRSPLSLLHAAEADLEAAKARRRNRPPEAPASTLLQLEADLHAALDRRELIAHFQPLYDLRSGHLVGFETLARWPHPDSGFVPPDVFIALAEDNGLIDAIGSQMLEAAGRFLAEHPDRSIAVYVNVSAKQASRRGFAREVADLLSATPDVLGRVVVELTESALVLDHGLVEHELRELRRLGVGVAIDDFGSGYSSLAQLQDLPVTELKIDRAFVQRAGAVGEGILEAMMRLAAHLGLAVVAEGVERPEQLRMLQDLGCDRAQGFLFSPALPADLAHALPPTMADPIAS